MKNSQISELYFVVNSPFRYYMFLLLSLFGGWSIAQDAMAISKQQLLTSDVSEVYAIIVIASLILFYIVRRNAIKKIVKIQDELNKH